MKRLILAAMLSVSALSYAGDMSDVPAKTTIHIVDFKPSGQDLSAELRKIASDAKAQGLTPYVQYTAEWCSHCKLLSASLADPQMVDAFKGTYIVRIDFDAWSEKMKDLGFVSKGIPVIFAIDQQGKPTGKSINGGAWGEDTPQNMAPPLKQFFDANKWST